LQLQTLTKLSLKIFPSTETGRLLSKLSCIN
jgi:hypothetical protein